MDTMNAIRARCSVREYAEKVIPRNVIESIVDCGRLAPTARKEEPWEFVAVTDKKILAEMADITDHGKFIRGCACAIVTFCRDTKYYLEDGCAATENMLVAAADSGVGACWVAGDKKGYCNDIIRLLKAAPGYKLVSIISLGYTAGEPKPIPKRSLESVLHWNMF